MPTLDCCHPVGCGRLRVLGALVKGSECLPCRRVQQGTIFLPAFRGITDPVERRQVKSRGLIMAKKRYQLWCDECDHRLSSRGFCKNCLTQHDELVKLELEPEPEPVCTGKCQCDDCQEDYVSYHPRSYSSGSSGSGLGLGLGLGIGLALGIGLGGLFD